MELLIDCGFFSDATEISLLWSFIIWATLFNYGCLPRTQKKQMDANGNNKNDDRSMQKKCII